MWVGVKLHIFTISMTSFDLLFFHVQYEMTVLMNWFHSPLTSFIRRNMDESILKNDFFFGKLKWAIIRYNLLPLETDNCKKKLNSPVNHSNQLHIFRRLFISIHPTKYWFMRCSHNLWISSNYLCINYGNHVNKLECRCNWRTKNKYF